jgi:low affinity Fe/Cu permease
MVRKANVKTTRYLTTLFGRFAKQTSRAAGHPRSFVIALLTILTWAVLGPMFHYSDTWQLVINTSTTIVTFLMVFLIQNTQNRDSEAIHLKLDELIRCNEGAHNALLDVEDLNEQDFALIRVRYADLAHSAREDLKQGRQDTGKPEV